MLITFFLTQEARNAHGQSLIIFSICKIQQKRKGSSLLDQVKDFPQKTSRICRELVFAHVSLIKCLQLVQDLKARREPGRPGVVLMLPQSSWWTLGSALDLMFLSPRHWARIPCSWAIPCLLPYGKCLFAVSHLMDVLTPWILAWGSGQAARAGSGCRG